MLLFVMTEWQHSWMTITSHDSCELYFCRRCCCFGFDCLLLLLCKYSAMTLVCLISYVRCRSKTDCTWNSFCPWTRLEPSQRRLRWRRRWQWDRDVKTICLNRKNTLHESRLDFAAELTRGNLQLLSVYPISLSFEKQLRRNCSSKLQRGKREIERGILWKKDTYIISLPLSQFLYHGKNGLASVADVQSLEEAETGGGEREGIEGFVRWMGPCER